MSNDNKRMARVEREVREVVAHYLISDFRSPVEGLITVSRVWVSKDLRQGRVYISYLPIGDNPDPKNIKQVIKALEQEASELQRKLADELKMRYTPRLEFYADDTLEQSLKVQSLIHQVEQERIQKEKAESESED